MTGDGWYYTNTDNTSDWTYKKWVRPDGTIERELSHSELMAKLEALRREMQPLIEQRERYNEILDAIVDEYA